MRMVFIAPCASLFIVVGCGGERQHDGFEQAKAQTTQEALTPPPAQQPVVRVLDPTRRDAHVAMRELRNFDATSFAFDVGQPAACVSGKMGGQEVRSCQVCAIYVDVRERPLGGIEGVRVTRAIFAVPFRRAISYDQPEIEPSSPAEGVWVASFPARGPKFRPTTDRVLGEADFDRIGISMMRARNSQYFSIREPGRTSVIPNAQVLLGFLDTPDATEHFTNVVGECP